MRTVLLAVAAAISVPLLILNWIAAFGGGIWLLVIGQWRLVIEGVVAMIGAAILLPIVLIVANFIASPAVSLGNKSRWLVYPFLFLGGLFTFYILANWCVLVFDMLVNRDHGTVWPYALWAYAVATTPWTSMLQRDVRRNPRSRGLIWLSASQLGAFGILISVFVGNGFQPEGGMSLFFTPFALLGMLMGYVASTQRTI